MANQSKSPSLVIISNCSPGAAFVIQEVMKSFSVGRIIRPVWQCPPLPLSKRIKAIVKAPGLFLLEAINERYRSRTSSSISTQLKEILGTSKTDLPEDLIVDVPSNEINSNLVAELIRQETPDLLLVCGAPILREEIFSIPRLGAINLHLGIAPEYRGEHTILWPLKNHDYKNIGVTVHRITAKVDAGPVLARGYPRIEEGDDEVTLMAKSYRMGAELAAEVISVGAVNSLPTGQYFNSNTGKLIRYRDLNILNAFKELQGKVISRSLPAQTQRIERMYGRINRK